MSLEVEFVLLEPRNIELLSRGSALELACNVFLVITNDPVVSLAPVTAIWDHKTHLVIIPVVLTPSVLWVTKNLPASLIGL